MALLEHWFPKQRPPGVLEGVPGDTLHNRTKWTLMVMARVCSQELNLAYLDFPVSIGVPQMAMPLKRGP